MISIAVFIELLAKLYQALLQTERHLDSSRLLSVSLLTTFFDKSCGTEKSASVCFTYFMSCDHTLVNFQYLSNYLASTVTVFTA